MPTKTTIQPGDRFGKLVAQTYHPGTHKKGEKKVKGTWECLCDCGNTTTVITTRLLRGITRSCGCLRGSPQITHGFTRGGKKLSELKIFYRMMQRCHNPKNKDYLDYGGRGITVWEEWRTDFMAFYNHVGPRPSPKHTLERKDNNKGYEPGNVKWATRKEQSVNKRNNVRLTLNGRSLTINEWAEDPEIKQLGLTLSGLKWRKRSSGMTDEQILTTPNHYKK